MTAQPSPVQQPAIPATPATRTTTAGVAGGSNVRNVLLRIAFWLILLIFTIIFVYPFIWLISASLKSGAEVFNNEIIPNPIQWENYSELLDRAPVAQWALNSVIVSFLAAITVMVSSALVAFGFAYFRFPYRDLLFGIVLATMLLPGAVTMIPQFLIWDFLGWNNTLVPLWAGNLFASPFYIFLLRQFFLGLPRDLWDAAKTDGANPLRMWWSIAVPLTAPALIVVFVFELKAAWTDVVRPLIFLRDIDLYTLPRGLLAIINNPSIGGGKDRGRLAAARAG